MGQNLRGKQVKEIQQSNRSAPLQTSAAKRVEALSSQTRNGNILFYFLLNPQAQTCLSCCSWSRFPRLKELLPAPHHNPVQTPLPPHKQLSGCPRSV